MALDNAQKDTIGYLRAIFFTLLVWNIVPVVKFPIDDAVEDLLKRWQPDADAILSKISEMSLMNSSYGRQELSSAFYGLTPGISPFYSLSTVNALLSLYSGEKILRAFDFENRRMIYEQTKPIYIRVLRSFLESALWVRITLSEDKEASSALPLTSLLVEIFSAIQTLMPPDADMPNADRLLSDAASEWLNLRTVQEAIQSPMAVPQAFAQVVQEIKLVVGTVS